MLRLRSATVSQEDTKVLVCLTTKDVLENVVKKDVEAVIAAVSSGVGAKDVKKIEKRR